MATLAVHGHSSTLANVIFFFFIIFYLLAWHNICLPRPTCPTPPVPSLHACHLTTSAVIDMLLPLLFLLLLLLSHSRAVLFSSLPAFFSVSFFRCYFVILYFDLIVVFFATFLSAPKNVFINNFVALLICCCRVVAGAAAVEKRFALPSKLFVLF